MDPADAQNDGAAFPGIQGYSSSLTKGVSCPPQGVGVDAPRWVLLGVASSGSHEPEREEGGGTLRAEPGTVWNEMKNQPGPSRGCIRPLPFYFASFGARDVDPQPF